MFRINRTRRRAKLPEKIINGFSSLRFSTFSRSYFCSFFFCSSSFSFSFLCSTLFLFPVFFVFPKSCSKFFRISLSFFSIAKLFQKFFLFLESLLFHYFMFFKHLLAALLETFLALLESAFYSFSS